MSKLKRFLIIMLDILLIAGTITTIALTAEDDPQFVTSSYEIDYDADINERKLAVTVSMPNGVSFAGLRIKLGFDPTIMTPKTVATGSVTQISHSWNFKPTIDGEQMDLVSYKDYYLAQRNEHLSELTMLMISVGSANLDYSMTTNGDGKFLTVNFIIENNAPAGEYPITLSFPTDANTNPDYPYDGNAIKMVDGTPQNLAVDLVSGKLTINPIPITYTASITGLTGGEAVYGTTLTANVASITDARSGASKTYTEAEVNRFTYQWKRGGVAISAATNATYSPTAEDILASDSGSSVLSVTIGASGNFMNAGVSAGPVKAVRAPYSGTIPVPVLSSRTTNSITVSINSPSVADSVCEFSKDGGANWQPGTTFTGLSSASSYTFCARVKRTSTHEASAMTAASSAMRVQLPVTGILAVSDTTPTFGDTLNADPSGLSTDFKTNGLIKATYTWYRGTDIPANVVGTGPSYTTVAADVGQTITLVINAQDDYLNNMWGFTGTVNSAATLPVAKAENTATPTVPSVSSNVYVNVGGLTLNIQTNQQYRIIQGTMVVSDWASYTGSAVQFTTSNTTWLKPATEYVIETRFTATSTHNTGTKTASISVTSAKWQLTTSSLEASPATGWKYGTQITATGSTSPAEAVPSLIYQWYRGTDAIVGANANVYTPVQADIGKILKVTLTVGGSYEWAASLNREISGEVSKAAAPSAPSAPTILETTYNTIKISTQAGYEYKLDNGSWGNKALTAGDFTFTGLSPFTNYSIYARIAETDTNFESASSTATAAKTLKQPLSGSVSISVSGGGDAEWDKTLTANIASVTPTAAVQYLVYNWYSGDDLVQSGSGSTYTLKKTDCGKNVYLALGAENSSVYTVTTPVQSLPIEVLAKTISGTAAITGLAADGAEWGTELTAVITGITPEPARTNITYSWSVGGTEKSIASAYTPASADVGSTLTLTLGGSGSYRGTVTTTTPIVKQTLIAKPTVTGSPINGHSISAGLTAIPAAAQTNIHYQWFRSATETGTGTAISGATSGSYTVVTADIGNWLYVSITVDSDNASYRGSTRSLAVEGGKEILTASVGITGEAKYGEKLTLTISSLTPAVATYDVVWYRGTTLIKSGDGAAATNKEYTLVKEDIGQVISATITGTGGYTGSPTAASTATVTKADGPAKPAAPTAVSNTYDTITVTGLAGKAYKYGSGSWSSTRSSDGTFDFTGLSPNTTYSIYCYIPESDTHFASAVSDASVVTTQKRPITGSVSIIGTLTYGQEMTANINSVLPAGAQSGLTYAWYRGDNAGSVNEAIGTTASTLTLSASDVGKYIKVVVTGNGDYTGTLSVTSSAAVAKANTTAPGTPTLNFKSDNSIIINSVVTNQYAISQTSGGALIWVDGQDEYLNFGGLLPNKLYYIYARVKATGTHNASDACTTPLAVTTNKQAIGGAVTITGSAEYGEVMTADITAVTPADAQNYLTYQWYRVDGENSTAISGATFKTYTVATSDVGLKLKVRALAASTSDYTSGVESSSTDVIIKKAISGSVVITGSANFGDTLSANIHNVAPAGAQGTLKYQWQRYYNAGAGIPGANTTSSAEWHNIPGATDSTYTVTGADIGTSDGTPIKLRVIVYGDDVSYTNFLYSGNVEPGKKVVAGTISITGTARYGSTVTASDSVNPSGADADMGYRWFIDGAAVSGRTASTFEINNAEWIGKILTVEKYVTDPASNYTGSIASAGITIQKAVNPGTTVPVQVQSFDKTSITIRVTAGQIYSINGGATWTAPGFNGIFSGLTPGSTYTIITKIPGSGTVEDSVTLSLSIQIEQDAISVKYEFYSGITGTVIVPERVEIGAKATLKIIAPAGYRLEQVFDSMPGGGVALTPVGNDTFTFVAGKSTVLLFIVFTPDTSTGGTVTSGAVSSAVSSVSSTVASKPSSVASSAVLTSSQASSAQTSSTGSDTDAPNMGVSGISYNAAGLVIALFGTLGIALVFIKKRQINH